MGGAAFRSSARLCFLRRQAALPPKKVPAAVSTQIVTVTAVSLVVIMDVSRFEIELHLPHSSNKNPLLF